MQVVQAEVARPGRIQKVDPPEEFCIILLGSGATLGLRSKQLALGTVHESGILKYPFLHHTPKRVLNFNPT